MGYAHGIEWTDEMICEKLTEIASTMKVPHMPTHKEMDIYTNGKALSNAVSKHGGTKHFSSLLDLPIKNCESKFGDVYEDMCAEYISSTLGFEVEKMVPRYPYDLLIDKNVKVDVKSSKLFETKKGITFYSFNLEKKKPTCDIYVCYCISDENEILKTYIIPSIALYNIKQLSVGVHDSIYNKYIDRWDFIKEYAIFFGTKVV